MRDSTSKGSSNRFAESPRSGGGVHAVKLALCAALLAAAAGAQTSADWKIDTFAGLPEFGDGDPAVVARLDYPHGVAADGAGNVYIADTQNDRIRKVDSSGTITTFAGSGGRGHGGDGGPAVEALLAYPTGVAADGAGNVYIADQGNNRIRKVDSSGTITTFAGSGEYWDGRDYIRGGYGGDGGPAVEALLDHPFGVATDGAGNLYIADTGNRRIRKVDSSGVITTIAGRRTYGFDGDGGPAVEALLGSPYGVAADSAGNVYIADRLNHRIRKVDSSGTITTIAGTGELGYGGDGGPAVEALLASPSDVATDGDGNVYIADQRNNRIRKVDSSGTITTFAGTDESGFDGDDGPAVEALLGSPYGVAADSAGNVYIADRLNHRIRKVDSSGTITTFAGRGRDEYREGGFGGDGGPAAQAQLRNPSGVATDGAGNVYIAELGNHRIRKVDSSGTITTFAGTGERGFGGDDGPAVKARLASPFDIALDADGNVYIADTDNNRIRKVDSSGTITTFAGPGDALYGGFGGDGGPAVEAQLASPRGVATDGAGNLYIADTDNRRIRKVDSSGTITTFAGAGGRGFGGDGGPAVEARLASRDVAVDVDGNLYIADQKNHRIRKVDSSGTITTFAGMENPYPSDGGFSGDGGPAVEARLADPRDVELDADGNLYISDASNHRIRMVDSSGIITTIAGSGDTGYDRGGQGGDGSSANHARFSSPSGIAVDSAGNLYIADSGNHRIRILTPMTEPVPDVALNAAGFTPGIAPGSIASLFGKRLALETFSASAQPVLPAALGGVRIEIIDSTSEARAARLLFVSPGQINFLMPDETAPGAAVLRLTREGEEPVELAFTIDAVAPGLFSANGTGEGIGAITARREGADGSSSNPVVFTYDEAAGRLVGVPLDLGAEGDQVFLTLFGTGIRGAGGAESVQATIGGSEVPVVSAGAQSGWAGLDQVEIGPLPHSLAGAGEVNVVVTAAGVTSNTVTIVME